MIGVDEVGRGCWAGPLLVVAARQILELPAGLKDSKQLSKKQREKFSAQLESYCQFGEGWVTAFEIDEHGLAAAMRLGAKRALADLNVATEEAIIIDGNINLAPKKFINIVCEPKADQNYPIVSAASIRAKVRRDKYMADLAVEHPLYSFESHVGYGTAAHHQALKTNGPLKGIHRLSYKPVQALAID